MNGKTAAVVVSALLGLGLAAIATALGASIQVALPIFVGAICGGTVVAFMKKN